MTKLTYPKVRRDDNFSENIHGVDVLDPYRWLEDNQNEDVKKFAEEQQNLTMSYIKEAPNRVEIKEKLTELVNYPKFDAPFKRGDNYFMSKNSGLQNQNVMYKFKNLNDEHEVFLDPNTFSEDGTNSLSSYSFSKDGKWIAYAISKSGSDFVTIFIRNVETKKDLTDKIERVKFTSISWTHDNLGFFYSRYNKEGDIYKETSVDENHKLYYHRINTDQSKDVLVYEDPEHPNYLFNGEVSDCGHFLNIAISEKCRDSKWYYAKLDENLPIEKPFKFYPIVDEFKNEYDYITNNGNLVYFKTNKNASNFRVCRLDLANPDLSNWVEIIPEDAKNVLSNAICIDEDKLALIYIKDVIDQLEIRKLENGELFKKFEIPIGTIGSFRGKRNLSEFFFSFTSFLSPGTIYYYDFKSGADNAEVFMQIEVKNFETSDYMTKQVFFMSKDGQVKVPMFITHHKDVKLDSTNPCILYSYGGFNISIQPYFSANRLLFMKYFKGVYAVCNVRGGGEYGQLWYDAGRLLNKQNTFEDFQQAAEYLIENGYTCKEKLIIEGGSNGGLTVSVCANQRPELFGAVLSHVGVLDLLRFHKFTIGHCWTSDYGDHEKGDDAELHFKNKLKLSPLHNVPKEVTKYPATLLLTSDHDNRVVPIHSYKYAAELQNTIGQKLDDPVLLRVDLKAGHGAGKSLDKLIDQFVDVFCFLQRALSLKFYN